MLLTPALISASRKTIAADFLADADQQKVKGYDHAFPLDAKGDASQPAAQVWSQDGKLQMTVYTSAPALQFYSGNYLGGTPSQTTEPYADWQGLALESEFLPDSPNPSAMAAAGLCITSGPGVRQPDGISVYRPIIASALHQGALLFVPAPPLCRLFFSNLLYFPSPKDIKNNLCITSTLHCATIFAMVRDKHCRAPNHGNIMRIVINQ